MAFYLFTFLFQQTGRVSDRLARKGVQLSKMQKLVFADLGISFRTTGKPAWVFVIVSLCVHFIVLFLDIDECAKHEDNDCEQLCLNTDGSYVCNCSSGFRLNADESTCDGKIILECVSCIWRLFQTLMNVSCFCPIVPRVKCVSIRKARSVVRVPEEHFL